MKKFTKLLILLLSIVTIVTAFTVVALAEDTLTPLVKYENDYDGKAVGTTAEANGTGGGRFEVTAEEGNSNHYISLFGEYYQYYIDSKTGEEKLGSNYSYLGGMYSSGWQDTNQASLKTPLSNYPYAVFEADVMKPASSYESFTVTMYIKNASSKAVGSVTYKGSDITTIINAFPKNSYEWAKLTFIYKYYTEKNEDLTTTAYVDAYVYVNKKEALKKEKALSFTYGVDGKNSTTGKTESELYFTDFRISASSTKDSGKRTSFDNVKLSAYPKQYDVASILAETYPDGYQFPYGKTYALIDGVGYDNLDAAFAAAGENQTVSLRTDVEDYIINKPIKVDTNKYKIDAETGELVVTGEYYAFTYASTEGYSAECADGIYTFTKSANTVTVNWDPVCSEDCDCFAEYGGHTLTDSTVVSLGEIPAYLDSTPTFDMAGDYTHRFFLGWSYENDGTVDELTEITEAQVANGTLNIYPVYTTVKYAVEIVNASGKASYYVAADFDSAVAAAASGSTVKLLDDVTMYQTICIKTNSYKLTLDLNGYTLTRHYTTLTKYNAKYDEASGTYVKDGDSTGTIAEGRDTDYIVKYSGGGVSYANCVFGINASYVNVTLTSSRPNAEIHAYHVTGDALTVNGETVKTENTTAANGLMLFYLTPAGGSTFTLDTENVTAYCGTLFSAEHGANGSEIITVNGGNFYTVGKAEEGVFGIRNGEHVVVNDANFYCDGNEIIRNQGSNRDKNTTFVFTNCNIYDGVITSRWVNDVFTFNNCQLVIAPHGTSATVILGDNTAITSSNKIHAAAGFAVTSSSTVSYSYAPIGAIALEYDLETGKFISTVSYSDAVTGIFAYEVKKGTDVEADLISDAMLSMVYHINFKLVFYLPVSDVYAYTNVSNFQKAKDTVLIDGEEYYVYEKSLSTAGASDTVYTSVHFTKDGKEYVQSFRLSALAYAELILSYPENDIEAKAVANMVRFIKEARTLAGLTVSDKFASLEALYAPTQYQDKTAYDDLDADYSALAGVGISFALNGANAAYVIDLPVATFANAANATVTVTFEDGTVAALKTATTTVNKVVTNYIWYTTSTRHISNILDQKVTISITFPAADESSEDTVISGTYSVGAYIQAMDNSFAKAMYEFGIAAKAYREYLEETL